jgi:hypothetical protein
MPHWDGVITTQSPPILESCNGDPVSIHETIIGAAPQGANVRAISFEAGRNAARVRVEGPNAEDFLRTTLQATDVAELLNAHEAHGKKDGS